MQDGQQNWEIVYRTSRRSDVYTRALVLRAVGIRFETLYAGGELALVVASEDADSARTELEAYEEENAEQPTEALIHPERASGWPGVFGYVIALVVVTVSRHQGLFSVDWFDLGKTHATLIRDGQWWRTITALTLHADLSHLVANIVFGGLFGLFAGQLLGSGLAWLCILVAGALGNLINAWVRPSEHTSIGASTAVFAALGIVAALAWMRRSRPNESRLARWAPLVGAVVLLSFLGTGGVQTDVLAHVAGFFSGGILGALLGALGPRILIPAKGQCLLGLLALAVLAIAWAYALT